MHNDDDDLERLELPCGTCGMPCKPGEYHPMAACWMFKACGHSKAVRVNLKAVQDDAILAERERAQAAEPVATMHVGMFGSTGFTGLDAGAKLPEGDYQLYTTPARPAVTEEMLDRAEAAVVMQMCSDDNGDREIARAAIEAALGGGDA